METLKFAVMKFDVGMNITVRDGTKWATRVKPGDKVILAGLNDEPEQRGIIHALYITQFWAIPAYMYEFEHDPACRTYPGLKTIMEGLYPGFNDDSIVTAIMFVMGG